MESTTPPPSMHFASATSNACDAVRQTCRDYVETDACRQQVTIDIPSLAPLAAHILQAKDAAIVEWDEENWHYRCPPREATSSSTSSPAWPVAVRNERIALYILALDSINFCFWPEPTYEYVDIATTLTNAAMADHTHDASLSSLPVDAHNGGEAVAGVEALASPYPGKSFALSASNLESMTLDQMRDLFTRHHATGRVPPNLEERCRLWNEVGRVLRTRFDGSVSTLIASAQGSAPALVQLLVDNFEGFQDRHSLDAASAAAATTSSTVLHFYKRAQICVGDWNEAMKLNLKDMDQVTTFADYRVPQLLRHHGVLVYSAPLAASVDGRVELAKGCDEELAIRACTVTAVELLVQELKVNTSSSIANNDTTNAQMKWNAVATDWYLWQVGERMQNDGELQPHHRVRTIYY